MLSLERRHTKKCNTEQEKRHQKNPVKHPKPKLTPKDISECDCPFWVVGVDVRGSWHRESLDTTDLLTATDRKQKLERGEPLAKPIPDLEIEVAYKRFTSIRQSQRGIKDSSIYYGYDPAKNALMRFAVQRFGTEPMMNQVDEDFLDALVAEWKDLSVSTRHHRIHVLQKFFSTAESRKWVARDPSKLLERPRRPMVKGTLPFDLEKEDPRILEAIPHWNDSIKKVNYRDSVWSRNPETGAALLYVLRFTGLRISDAAFNFDPRSIVQRVVKGNNAHCYFLPRQQKTDEPVFLVIRPDIAEFIINAPRLSEEYAFYDPNDWNKDTDHRRKHMWCTRIRQNLMVYLERTSGVPDIHPHRFRDTFVVDLLRRGVDFRTVSRFIGHRDPGTTLKYYGHWIPDDQRKAIQAMMDAWENEQYANVIPFPLTRSAS